MAATKDNGKKNKLHVPTEKNKAEVAALTSFGIKQEEIALYLGISVDTLDRRYRHELDTSITRANAKVAAKLYKKCIEDEDLTAIIFWLKTRARWRTTDELSLELNQAIHDESMSRAKLLEKEF